MSPEIAQAQRPIGIDVSGYQSSSLNWPTLKNTYGISFGWAKATEATNLAIGNFPAFEANAKAAGVYIGAYHFARYDLDQGTNGATAEANYFWSVAKNYLTDGGYLMPMLDVEASFSGYTKTTLSQWINQWCVTLTNNAFAAGYVVKPCIYASSSHAAAMFDSTVTEWIPYLADWNGEAQQTGAPAFAPWSNWTFWQYNDMNAAQAITTGDGDVFNGTLEELKNAMLITAASFPLYWSGAAGDTDWSTQANWEGGAPGARADALFDLADAQSDFETNNVVNQNVSIRSLTYSNWTYAGTPAGYLAQNTGIGSGKTLTVTGGMTVGVSSGSGKGFTANPLTYVTISGTDGTLSVTGGDFNVGYQSSDSSVVYVYGLLDMSSLGNFNYAVSSGTFGIAAAMHRRQGGEVYLAKNTQITAENISAGIGLSGVETHAGILHLGQNNVLNSDNIIVGKDSEGDLNFRGEVTNATLRIRGNNGTSPVAAVYLGWTTASGGTWGHGTNDLTAGVVDISATNLFVAYHAGDISGPTQITRDTLLIGLFAGNNIRVQNLTIGSNPGGPTVGMKSQCEGLVDVQDGDFAVSNVVVGSAVNAGSGSGTLNLHGGTFTAGTVLLANLGGTGAVNGFLNLSGGALLITGDLVAGGGNSLCAITNASLNVGGQIGSVTHPLSNLTLNQAMLKLAPRGGTNLCLFVDTLEVEGDSVISITGENPVPGRYPIIEYGSIIGARGMAGLSVSTSPLIGATLENNTASQTVDLVLTALPRQTNGPVLSGFVAMGANTYQLTGAGVANHSYFIYASTNIALPMSRWTVIGGADTGADGVIRFVDQSTNAQRFYRLGEQ